MKHGQRTLDGIGRYCSFHKIVHGRLYICESYPDELKEQIKQEDAQHVGALRISMAILIVFAILMSILS